MRLWSVHPRHLDRQGLVACWREALLAQAVLAGRTKGYQHHPQLARFRTLDDPVGGLGDYLAAVAAEATVRGYRFDTTRIDRAPGTATLTVTDGQLAYERGHLLAKLTVRNPELVAGLPVDLAPHPMFEVVGGPVAEWERP